ncbi:TPA: hypothetical protein U0431_000440 [Streptococcus suis]|nr:hypothetical protein [Streptococcus suis]
MKKIINQTIILLSATCLLAACSTKTQETQTKTSTSQTTQSSTKQSSSASSSKAEKTQENKSEQTSSTSTQVSSSSAETSKATTDKSQQTGETTTSKTAESVISSETTHTQLLTLPATPVPDTLVGKWIGTSPQARYVELTVSPDGTFTTYEDFRLSEDEEGDHLIHTYTARVTDLVEYAPKHYLIRGAEGEYSALLPAVTGLGGRIAPGFILEDGQYKVILWGNPFDSSIEAKYDLVSEPRVWATLEKAE